MHVSIHFCSQKNNNSMYFDNEIKQKLRICSYLFEIIITIWRLPPKKLHNSTGASFITCKLCTCDHSKITIC